ncbi:MOSC domain-containing protein [Micromonospora sp. NPDC048830]|uniref:MOSC domain-containing protein n=1 Tax=Micromonospora sp. NPDC048830 TaxID=3364257 RepID=UPI00372087F5
MAMVTNDRGLRPDEVALAGRIEWLCVGTASVLRSGDQEILTGYLKEPVDEVRVSRTGLPGDEQVYETHGGPDRVVLSYSTENYAFWRETLGLDLPLYAALGENFTTTGLTEFDVHVGDVFAVGEAVIQAAQPRSPCHKVAARYRRPKFAIEVARSHRTGILYRVIEEGVVRVGDSMRLTAREDHGYTIADANQILLDRKDIKGAAALLAVGSLAEAKKAELRERVAKGSPVDHREIS